MLSESDIRFVLLPGNQILISKYLATRRVVLSGGGGGGGGAIVSDTGST